ncbi:hypothetical protein [Undibacterium flavidum]|uniref:Uncharacterized protein n=1 Tax=Undibacterium flavidum TaxID=2762297 RepID=A0ABR6YBV3_9BURK|nr:hypothetical protein [Undibacterium flavidum]MBC3873742.1 hypothetical protein [Undibacterium flavidum]
MIEMNQYLAVMVIGLGFSNFFRVTQFGESTAIVPRHWHFSTNFSGCNFSISTLTILIFGMFFSGAFDLIFCAISLVVEGLNFKWRDFRSSAYAVFVGVTTLLFRFWHPSTIILILVSACLGLGIVLFVRWMFGRKITA